MKGIIEWLKNLFKSARKEVDEFLGDIRNILSDVLDLLNEKDIEKIAENLKKIRQLIRELIERIDGWRDIL